MGVSGDKLNRLSPSIQDILATLDSAESLFWADLALVARRGNVSRVRDAAVSLAMIRALQSSLGRAGKAGPVLTAALLGACVHGKPSRKRIDFPLRCIHRHHITKRAS